MVQKEFENGCAPKVEMTMSTRVLITGEALAQILARHPEVEIELVKNASAQVAEQLKKKIDKQDLAEKVFAGFEEEIKRKLRSQYTFPKEVWQTIDKAILERIERHAHNDIEKALNTAADEAVKKVEERLTALIASTIATKFKSMVDAAASLRS